MSNTPVAKLCRNDCWIALSRSMVIVTGESFQPVLWTAGLMITIQALDNYFIEPYVVGGEVNLSAMATIVIICAVALYGA